MKKIAITGANGYLASLIQTINHADFDFIPVTRKDVDLANPEAVEVYFKTLEYFAENMFLQFEEQRNIAN